ncbi:hypothetical protein ABW636_17395 [Aquimarina sp. 2201CG1-2-11]|uniref:hypothetical protein n=1 Tax=Aquimarina discodermiae TaxID=3231043 RepID=UPI0034635EE2
MENRCRIADAMNTYNLGLKIILSKGYKIFLIPDKREGYVGDFCAVKGSRTFFGSDPLRLLGIISIWENTGDDWQSHMPEEDFYDEILSRAYPDSVEDYNKLSDKEFADFVSDYRMFFEDVLYEKFPKNPSREDLFQLVNTFYLE